MQSVWKMIQAQRGPADTASWRLLLSGPSKGYTASSNDAETSRHFDILVMHLAGEASSSSKFDHCGGVQESREVLTDSMSITGSFR